MMVKRQNPLHARIVGILLGAWLAAGVAGAETIPLDTLVHGDTVTDQFLADQGVTIRGINRAGGPNRVVAFDSNAVATRDPDLEGTDWSGGSLAAGTDLGVLLIIQEGGGDPDDEGGRAGGSIFFDFNRQLLSFGFDLVDIEGPQEFGADRGYFAAFDAQAQELARVSFAAFIDDASPWFVAGLAFGDHSANRVPALEAALLGIAGFRSVEINLGGSGAVGNVTYTASEVPEASGWMLLSLSGLLLVALRRPGRGQVRWAAARPARRPKKLPSANDKPLE